MERALGPDHPDTLNTRSNIAYWTGQCGDAAGALRLSRELLPDRERVLGPDHPDTLMTRSNIAYWTGQCGDAAEALRLFQELLPDHGAGARPGPPRHPRHPEQHRVLGKAAGRERRIVKGWEPGRLRDGPRQAAGSGWMTG